MTQIWKIDLGSETDKTIKYGMPVNSAVVKVANQNDSVCIWFDVDITEEKYKEKNFQLVCTGMDAPDGSVYQGTAFLESGQYVLHVFEIY